MTTSLHYQRTDSSLNQGGYDTTQALQAQAAGLPSAPPPPQQMTIADLMAQQQAVNDLVRGRGSLGGIEARMVLGSPGAQVPQYSRAQQQMQSGIQQATNSALSAGQGARGVAPGIAQALAARQAGGVQIQGNQQMAILQAQERAAAEQALAEASLREQQMELQQNIGQTEYERMLKAAEMAQQGSMVSGITGGLFTLAGGAAGGPGGAQAFGSLGRGTTGGPVAAAGQLGY